MLRKILFTPLWLAGCLVLDALPPQTFHNALRQRYPQATDITWRQMGNHYVATFQLEDFLTRAWLTTEGEWLMTDTDLQTADQLPPTVYNYFTLSSYAQWNLADVHRIELADGLLKGPNSRPWSKRTTPSRPNNLCPHPSHRNPVRYVLIVNYDNSSETYQLFYTPDGVLVRTRDVSYLPVTLTPQDFL